MTFPKNQRIVTLQVLKQLEELLPAHRFARVHRSYIVALDKINIIERQELHIKDQVIPIADTYLEGFYKKPERKRT